MLQWSAHITHAKPQPMSSHEKLDRAWPFRLTTEEELKQQPYIEVDRKSVTFYGQTGPVEESGVNGCQVDDLITFALGTLQVFNERVPSRETSLAITKLQEALSWLEVRRIDREWRGVEGTNKK